VGRGHAHEHPHPHRHRAPAWGEPRVGPLDRLLSRARALLGAGSDEEAGGLRDLPLALRRGPLARPYLDAERGGDHRRAAVAANAAMEQAAGAEEWWAADIWGHRALWHFEQAEMTLQATRQARRIGDLRWAAGDPASARRYYAEAIDEARDIGAEHEQGLAALGLGRSLLDLGRVTEARRIADGALTLLERSGAPRGELEAARALIGTEVAVGETRAGIERTGDEEAG
jgi:tetratricopeptide (TPR) repeat protein